MPAERLSTNVDRLVLQGPEALDAPGTSFGTGVDSVHVSADFTRLDDVVAAATSIRQAAGGAIHGLINNGALNAVSISPGVVNTALLHAMFGSIGASVEHGFDNVIAALDTPTGDGAYFDDGREAPPSAEARDDTLVDDLMTWTLAALEPFRAPILEP